MSKFTLLRALKRHILTEGFQMSVGLMVIRPSLPAFLYTRIKSPCVAEMGFEGPVFEV